MDIEDDNHPPNADLNKKEQDQVGKISTTAAVMDIEEPSNTTDNGVY